MDLVSWVASIVGMCNACLFIAPEECLMTSFLFAGVCYGIWHAVESGDRLLVMIFAWFAMINYLMLNQLNDKAFSFVCLNLFLFMLIYSTKIQTYEMCFLPVKKA